MHYSADYISFKNVIELRVLNPLFTKLRTPALKINQRTLLHNAIVRLFDMLFLHCSNYAVIGDEDEVTIDPDKHAGVWDLFIDSAVMITSHPSFTWKLAYGERGPKPNDSVLTALHYVDELLPNHHELKSGLIGLLR